MKASRGLICLLLLCAVSLFAQPSRFVFAVVTGPQAGWAEPAAGREQFARAIAFLAGQLHRNTTGGRRGMAMLVTLSSLRNDDGIPPGYRTVEVNCAGFAETYVPLPVRP